MTSALRRAVAFDGTCLVTMDPATLLPTGEVTDNGLPPDAVVRLSEIELRGGDVNTFTALARAPQPAASLSAATGGDLDRSIRQRELRRPHGFGDELRVVCSDATGTWGALTLLRVADRPHFTRADVRIVASLAEPLADGLRRVQVLAGTLTDTSSGDTGLLVLTPGDDVTMTNGAAEAWLDELGADGRHGPTRRLPVAVRAVANQARATGDADPGLARARLRGRTGRWILVRGSLLGDSPQSPVAIMIEAARAPELAPLIADAYGFTERERLLTELVARGLPTTEIAQRLHLSAYTVQDHLKSIFDKTGASSRGDLVARIFFEHYAPRLFSG
jgi:DNA-binding CsgD family transcriptional regulator